MKTCSSCKQEKPLDEFYRNKGTRDRLASQCKACSGLAGEVFAKSHRKELSDKSCRLYRENPEHQRTIARKSILKCVYGLEFEDYLQILLNQQNKCAICRKDFLKTPHVDHDHKTGKVRGLLCQECNHGVGNFEDSPARIRDAANYLDKANQLK